MNEERLKRVVAKMKEEGIDQILVTDPTSVFYLTGHYEQPWERFWALYLNVNGGHKLIANRLFTLPEVTGIDIVWYSDGENGVEKLTPYIEKDKVLGVDNMMWSQFLLKLIDLGAAAGFKSTSYIMSAIRACKDEEEQKKMIEVSLINDRAMERFKELIHEGITEVEMANQMLGIYQELGADDYSFTPLVAFGANAAKGHHGPDNTVLKDGDCVLIDVGCRKDMFCADMTRTFFFRRSDDEAQKVYNTVLKAQLAAEEAIRPGVKLKDIDSVARDIITEAGYGEYFTHRLGHFIGYDVHEAGEVSQSSDMVAAPGMIFSIEPGIYVPDKVGVRIEDLVLVTENGAEPLNHYSKDLAVVDNN